MDDFIATIQGLCWLLYSFVYEGDFEKRRRQYSQDLGETCDIAASQQFLMQLCCTVAPRYVAPLDDQLASTNESDLRIPHTLTGNKHV